MKNGDDWLRDQYFKKKRDYMFHEMMHSPHGNTGKPCAKCGYMAASSNDDGLCRFHAHVKSHGLKSASKIYDHPESIYFNNDDDDDDD